MSSTPKQATYATVPWNPVLAIFYIVFLFVAAQFTAYAAIAVFGSLQHWSMAKVNDILSSSVGGQFAYTLLAEVLTIGGVLAWLAVYKTKPGAIGLKRPRWKDPLYGIAMYIPYVLVFIVMTIVATQFIPGFNADQKQDIGFNNVYGATALTLTFVSLVILPPLAEEILMRGLLFTSLRKRLRFGWALLITSLIFAAAHLPEGGSGGPLYIGALDTFFLSVALCYLREKTDSLWPGITLHALKNLIAFLSLFVFVSR